MIRRLVVASALLALTLALAGSASAEDVVTLDHSTPVAAFGGRLLWSRFDPVTDDYALVTRAGGIPIIVPVAHRAVPFDADLGPGPDGGTVAVYSRCARETTPSGSFTPALYGLGKGCDIYQFDFATGRETRVTAVSAPDASEFWPTIWRSTIAYARVYDSKPGLPYLYVRAVGSSRPSTRLPGGPRSTCGNCTGTRNFPIALELYGKRLGFTWSYTGTGEGLDSDIRMDTVGAGHTRVAHQNGGGLTQVQLGWPAFEDGRLYWAASCFGDPGGCPGRYGLRRYRISSGVTATAPGPPSLLAADRDAGLTWALDDGQPGTSCLGDPEVTGGTCTLRSLAAVFSGG
jgi:hypothetical protein